jgi:hypothetical protein
MKNTATIVVSALTVALALLIGLIDRAAAQNEALAEGDQAGMRAPLQPTPAVPIAKPKPAVPTHSEPELPPGYVRLFLIDGSILHGKLTTPEFTLTTDFGTLKIPAPLVTGMVPGLDAHPKLRARLAELINDLGSEDEQKVAKATPELTRMGPEALGELTAAQGRAKSENVQHLLQEVIDAIREAQADEADLEPETLHMSVWLNDDSISTPKFTAVGKLQPQAVQLTTSFGDVTIKLAELKRIALVNAPGQETLSNAAVTVLNGGQDTFKATGVSVVPGDKLVFTARGALKMTPWDDSISATPDGEAENCGFAMPNIPQGALVGRIGNGPVFKIGARLTMTVDRPGQLKVGVGIEPGMWANLAQRIKSGEAAAAIMAGQFDVRVLHQPKK